MALYPGGLIPWIEQRFLDVDGNPLSGGFVYSYVAGTDTPQDTFTSADLDPLSINLNPIQLDSNGRPPTDIFLSPVGYKFVVTDVDAVEQYTIDLVEDVGQVFAANFGNLLSEGGKDVVSGYIVLTTDRLITVDSTGGADPCIITLLPAPSATQPLTIKNLGTVDLSVTPDGSDTIDGINAAFTVTGASSPTFPTITLVSDAVSSYYIVSSHGL